MKNALLTSLIIVAALSISCQRNTGIDEEVRALNERVILLEDSINELNTFLKFKAIWPQVIPVKKTEDSVTYKVFIMADELLIGKSITKLDFDILSSDSVKYSISRKNGCFHLQYPRQMDGVPDTVKARFSFYNPNENNNIEIIEDVVLK